MTRLLTHWLPVAAWMGLIFFVSNQPDLQPPGPPGMADLIADSAHFLEYLVLGLLLARATGTSERPTPLVQKAAIWFAASLYGVTDELHQGFVPGRTVSGLDVAVDALGACIGIAIAVWWERKERAPLNG